MKKALSIILCLAMLMSTVPMSVFAAPAAVTTGDSATEFTPELPESQENDSEKAELAADGTVLPVSVSPKNGETVDRRYPVAYYTFGKNVVIDADTVTLENAGNDEVGGVYFDEETNTIWVFPAKPETTVSKNNKVTYTAWTSNFATEDGSLLSFPGVSFNLETSIPSDGENIIPFGNMEYGWTPFDLEVEEDYFAVVEDPTNPDNHVTARTWKKGASKWPHAHADVAWTPGATYKIEAKVMAKDFVNDAGNGGNSASATITPDPIYTVPSFSCTNKSPSHPNQTGTICTTCGKPVDREHETSFSDHPSQENAASVSITSGVNSGWQTISYEITVRDNADLTKLRALSIYSNPGSNYATEFYIDDVAVYEKVTVTYAAGRDSAKKSSRDQTAKKGYNGDKIALPDPNTRYQSTKAGYVLDGWTDGTNVYAVGEEYTVNGAATLTPNVVPEGDGYDVTFTVDEKFADSYAGPGVLSIAVGEALDLTADEFKLGSVIGYSVLGWKNKATGKFVTSVSGTKGEKIELVAVYELRTGIVVDTAAKAAELDTAASASVFDETVPGLKVTPAGKDPSVTFDGLAIIADEYSFVDVTYVNNDTLAAANGGEVYFFTTNSTVDAAFSAKGTKLGEEAGLVTYRYDLGASVNWADTCSAIRIDPYNNNVEFTITEIQFVENEVVSEIAVTDLAVPAISGTPDAEASVPADAVYAIESIAWDPECEYFAGSTEYTVVVKVAINKSGYMFTEETAALLNGENVDVEVTAKSATITKTFAATEAPKAIDITLTSADAITVNDGTLELTADVVPVNAGDVILPGTVTWEITGGDEDVATLDGNVLTAKWDGTVEVTATPDYDVTQTKAFNITISGQVGFYVTYDAGTAAAVSNMPGMDRAKRDYTVSSMIPTRDGFAFDGWTLEPGSDDVVTELTVTEDTTLYARWMKGGYIAHFDNEGDAISGTDALKVALADGNSFGANSVQHTERVELDVENSEFAMTLNGGNDFYMTLSAGSAKAINLDNVSAVEYGFRTDAVGSFGCTLYYATKDENGAWIAPEYAADDDAYIANRIEGLNIAVDGNVNTLYKLRVDTTARDVFRGYLNHVRLDIENSQNFGGKTIYMDYVKLIGAESVEAVELDIDEPKASDVVYGLSAVSTASDAFEIKKITWEGPELVDGKYYAGASEYTAKVEIQATAGYALSDVPSIVTVNGEDAEIVVNGDKAVVTYTFPATETLETFELRVQPADGAPAEITTSLGTLQLDKRIYAAAGVVIPDTDVYWSVDPSQKKYGWVDANGLVTGNTDCDALVVTATSKYNPTIKTSIEIKISGQIPEKNIYFAAGTGEAVENLPAATTAKDEYVLPMDVIPTRTGYAFKGWSKVLGGDIVKVDDVKADTTYYAVWGYAKGEDFEGTTDVFKDKSNVTGTTLEDGILSVKPTNGKINEGFILQAGSGIFGSRNRIKTDDVEYVEIKTNLAPENLEICVYVQTSNRTGGETTAWNEAANTRFYSHANSIKSNPDQDIFKYCTQEGDWYIYKLPASLLKHWNNYLNQIRFNFIQRDMESKDYAWLEYPADFVAKFDYIRFVGKDIPVMDITGIGAPKVKEEASTTATAKQADAFKVTSVEWSPALLGGIFFGSATEYTVTMQVEVLKGYNGFSNPPARVTVNGKEAEYKRNSSTKATITYTFPATEDVGELALVNVSLHESTDDGYVTETKQIFSGDDFDLTKFSATNNPTGKRWTGWSETEGGELITGTINITEDTDYYAYYEDITGYDFSNKYHKNIKNVKASEGTAAFDGAWVVVTPEYDDSNAVLTLDGMLISSADYDYVEIIYDGSLEDANNENRFNETFAPVLKLNGTHEAAVIEAEPVIASNRVSYKYTYDLTVNGKPDTITSFELAPYAGKPAWAVTSVKLIPNAALEESAAITGIKAPETWLMPDVSAEVNEGFEIASIDWSSEGGFNDDGSYKSETAYTVTIVVKPTTGNKITLEEATIDGVEADSAELGADGNLVVKKTFAATEALVDFTLTVEDAEISVADGTVKLVPTFTPAVEVQTVKWAIVENGPEGKSATIDENGVVKAYYDGVVKVKATADYNPLISAEATVTITNQIKSFEVTFDPNTKSEVTNMPETVNVKLDYVLPKEAPVRPGFSFAGWVKSPEDTAPVAKDYITEKTTYYALWVRGLHYEFNDENENPDKSFSIGTVEYSKVDTENGVLEFQPKISSYNSLDTTTMIKNKDSSPMFKGSDYPIVVVRMKSTMGSNAIHKIYYTSKDATGKDIVANFSEAEAVSVKTAITAGEYTEIVFDMSVKSGWSDGYITAVRFDPIDGDASMDHLNAVMSIDYIRAVSYETGVVEVTGVDAPVAKAVADRDAVSKDESKYIVTDVSWEGGLLYDNYFDGETVYTACVTVKGAIGYFVSDAPTKATVNGKETKDFSYNAETGELTIKYTFPATGVLESSTAHDITLYGKDNNGQNVAEVRTIFEGDTFDLGTYKPANIPAGKRWVGWSETDGAAENTAPESFVVDGPVTYYAVYADLTEFNYSNYYHQFGTEVKFGTGTLKFEDGLAVVTPASKIGDTALITPAMNIDGSDFGLVEVYYSATLESVHNTVEYENIFSSQLKPALKFSTTAAPNEFSYSGTIVSVEKVLVDGNLYQKYTYDMTTAPEWAGSVAKLYLDPYNGYPVWGVGIIKLIENEVIFDTAEIELASPEAWATPDIADNASINDEYLITDLSWTPASDVFAANTAYTVKVTYKPVAGYKVSVPTATINGEAATVTDNGNDTYTASYKFAKTNALKDVEVVITGASTISSKGRYLELKGATVAKDGSEIPVTDVTWSVRSKGTDVELATVSERGRVYPLSNGTVIVTATSVYNPAVSATHEVKITNQADLVKVTFDKNTQAEVGGMPEPVYVYGKFEPEAYSITRDGFFFMGWSTDEDALTPDSSFNITEDTTLYAKWGAGYEWSFDNSATSLALVSGRTATYENGIATISAPTTVGSQIVSEKAGLTSLGLETSVHTAIEIRISLPVASQVKYYLRSSDGNGAESPWNESANTNSISQSLYPANDPGEFQVINYNLSNHGTWNTYPLVERVRLDLPQAGPDGGMQIDYIRLLSSERSVKFDGNGGLIPLYGGEVTSFKETYKTGTITLPEDPTREGYEFLGWAKATEGYSKLYNNKFTVTDNVTLYAIWTPAAVLDEETVAAEGADVTVNEDGSATVTSTETTTPTVAVADEMEVGENQTIVVEVEADYASTENGDTVLSFVDENGTPHEVVLKEGGLDGEETIIVDLSEEGFEGTVTDVVLTLPTGVVNLLDINTVAFTTEELSAVFDDTAEDVVSINPTVTTSQGGQSAQHPGHVTYPTLGGGSVTENPSTTTKTPTDKKPDNLTRPADDAPITGGNDNPGTTTPAASSKFPLTKTYDGRFTDVTSANWFYGDVEKSYRLGLMNGKSDTTFVPEGTVTLAEAITVAARMNAIYNGQTITQGTGNSWYQPYVEYATKKAIITNGQYSDYTALATREQVALMFVRALPSSWYKAQNLFLTIPDVPSTSSSFGAIQRLYNAGVITGVDAAYNFKPADNIKRSELSAIINRVALVESRLRVVTEDEKNSNIKIFDTTDIMSTLTVGNCVEKEWTEKNGGAYAVPAKADPVVNGLQNLLGGTVDADTYKKVTVVIRSESEVVGAQGQMFFWSDTVQLSEANSVRVSLPKADAEGNIKIEFKMDTNAAWKGTMTNLRFDPFNAMFDFSIVSVTFE